MSSYVANYVVNLFFIIIISRRGTGRSGATFELNLSPSNFATIQHRQYKKQKSSFSYYKFHVSFYVNLLKFVEN